MAESETKLRIDKTDYLLLEKHLKDTLPFEGCGLLAGTGEAVKKVYFVKNILASSSAFEMDPEEQLEAMLDSEERGLDMLAIFHSHPSGPETPSSRDISSAYYPDAATVIVSFENAAETIARAFRIRDNEMREIPLIVR